MNITLKSTAALATLLLAMNVSAQTTPNTGTKTTPDGGTMNAPPPRHTDRATDTETQQNSAWQRFDQDTENSLELNDEQRTRLQDIDGRYDAEFRTLGDDPMNAPGYNELHERRNKDIRGVLTEEQYERWNRTNTAPRD